MVSLSSPVWPGTHVVDQAGLELTERSVAAASRVLGLNAPPLPSSHLLFKDRVSLGLERWLGAAFPEDLGSNPSTHMEAHNCL